MKGVGKSSEAIQQALKYQELSMVNSTAASHRISSKIYLSIRQYEKAIHEAEQAIEMEPNDPRNQLAKANCLIFAGRPEASLPIIEKSMELDPLHLAEDYHLLGLAKIFLRKFKDAIYALESALKLSPKHQSLLAAIAAAYANSGNIQKAREAMDNLNREWGYSKSLLWEVPAWPFNKEVDAELFVEGWKKAGITGGDFDYLKLFEKYKLKQKEIQDLTYGKKLTGKYFIGGPKWSIDFRQDGESSIRTVWGSENGRIWIEEHMLCAQWQKYREGIKYCGSIFRNPHGKQESHNNYIWKLPDTINIFRIEKE